MTDDLDRQMNPFRYDSDGNLTRAAREQDGTLHLDSYDGGRGGGPAGPSGPPLAVNTDLLNRRAGDCDRLAADFQRVCAQPLGDTDSAGHGMTGFTCAGAFGDLTARWKRETRYVAVDLIGKFASDLRRSAEEYQKDDQHAAGTMR